MEQGADHTWPNPPGWPPPYLHWVSLGLTSATLVVCSYLRSSGLPHTSWNQIYVWTHPGRFTSSQASTVTLRVLRLAAQASWGCSFKELDDGRLWSTWVEPGRQGGRNFRSTWRPLPLVQADPGCTRSTKDQQRTPPSSLSPAGCGRLQTEHTLQAVPQFGGRHGGVTGLGAPSALQTRRPLSQTGQAGRDFVRMLLHLGGPLAADPGQATRPPSAGTRPRPGPHRPRQPLITTSMNAAKGPLPLLPSRTPRNQVRGPRVPCLSSEDQATHCCTLWMSPPQRGPSDTEEA